MKKRYHIDWNMFNHLRTGDIIVFRGRGLLSRIITMRTGASHVGMIWKTEAATLLHESCARKNKKVGQVAGVGVTDLRRKLEHYKGTVMVKELSERLTDKNTQRLKAHITKTTGLPYEKKWHEFIGAAIDWIDIFKKTGGKYMFCSELTASCLRVMHMLGKADPPDNEWTPGDYLKEQGRLTYYNHGYKYMKYKR